MLKCVVQIYNIRRALVSSLLVIMKATYGKSFVLISVGIVICTVNGYRPDG
jgi:hypothetical protein